MPSFPTPSQIFQQYKTTLKALRPDINENDPSGEAFIRGRVLSGLMAGLYSDQKRADDDTFIRDARGSTLDRFGADYNIPRQPSTPAESNAAQFTGTAATVIPVGTKLRFNPTGLLYTLQSTIVIGGGGSITGTIICDTNGQMGNLASGGVLSLVAPIFGVDSTVTLISAASDGSDIETGDSYRARLLNRRQRPPAGGNEFDYPQFAFAADPTVRSAFIRRFARGLGTVDIYVTSGTTDIDTAITQGLPVLRIPSGGVIATIQDYYDHNVPLTDCPLVIAPTEIVVAASVSVALAAGLTLGTTVPTDPVYNPLGLTVQQLIQREVGRVMYKNPVGGRVIPGQPGGYLVASDIETQLDLMLSAVPGSNGLPSGKIPLLLDREVGKLDPPSYNKLLAGNELTSPGVITVTLGV
jgi:hypothetical protein